MQEEENQQKLQRQNRKFNCEYCYGDYLMSEMKTLNCDHRLCSNCLTQQIQSYIGDGMFKFEDIICPKCRAPLEKGADGSIDPNIVIHAISQEQWEKVCQLRINQIPGIMQSFILDDVLKILVMACLKYPKKLSPLPAKDAKQPFVLSVFSSLILEIANKLPYNQQQFQVQAKEAVRKAGMDVRKCPYCGYYATKDQGCQHVNCIQCKKDWTFCCEQKRNPIKAHGNHYHAKGCWCGDNWDGQDKIEKDCEECQALGRLCSKPGQINQDLIEFNRLAKEERDKRDAAQISSIS